MIIIIELESTLEITELLEKNDFGIAWPNKCWYAIW